MPIEDWIIGFGTVAFSVGGSYLVTRYQIKKQKKAREERETKEWYRKSSKLADRTEDDWWEVMNRGEASYEIVLHEVLNRRRDELEDHAAEGRTRDVDSEIVELLDQAAANLNVAASTSRDYFETEQTLMPVLDQIKDRSQEQLGIDGKEDPSEESDDKNTADSEGEVEKEAEST